MPLICYQSDYLVQDRCGEREMQGRRPNDGVNSELSESYRFHKKLVSKTKHHISPPPPSSCSLRRLSDAESARSRHGTCSSHTHTREYQDRVTRPCLRLLVWFSCHDRGAVLAGGERGSRLSLLLDYWGAQRRCIYSVPLPRRITAWRAPCNFLGCRRRARKKRLLRPGLVSLGPPQTWKDPPPPPLTFVP